MKASLISLLAVLLSPLSSFGCQSPGAQDPNVKARPRRSTSSLERVSDELTASHEKVECYNHEGPPGEDLQQRLRTIRSKSSSVPSSPPATRK